MHSVINSDCIISLGGIWRPSEDVLGNKVHCLNQDVIRRIVMFSTWRSSVMDGLLKTDDGLFGLWASIKSGTVACCGLFHAPATITTE